MMDFVSTVYSMDYCLISGYENNGFCTPINIMIIQYFANNIILIFVALFSYAACCFSVVFCCILISHKRVLSKIRIQYAVPRLIRSSTDKQNYFC